MKLFSPGLFILLLSFFQLTTETVAQNEKKNSTKTATNNHLEISFEQIDKRYCLYRQTTVAFFTTKLKFKNTGDGAIILSKTPFERIRDDLKRLDPAESKVYKSFAKGNYFKTLPPIYNGNLNSPDEKYFLKLLPNEIYEIENYPVAIDLDFKTSTILKAGDYSYQWTFLPFWFYNANSEILKERWKNYGHLWTTTLNNDPFYFTIDKKEERKIEDCEPLRQIPIKYCKIDISGEKDCFPVELKPE